MVGYKKMVGDRRFVPDDEALDFVMKECGIVFVDKEAPGADELKEMLVEWYFSGNWVRVDD